ncbi:WD40 repeat-like protein [Sistotremastrum suecicum HHB10207 ss-3]|uniref:WD40 repeat-like protein n=1 Tax=Sistotremastrum suecicum HHB10207 ss-3 TaxID=1314776 RepID=A0A166EJ54_9AGAM|nr:WD40 repeat-like protein [Sistotremastrum suecicum HHB10207 ss-3]
MPSTFDDLYQTYPTAVQTSLVSNALFARYDPQARFIAAGQYSGSTVIWDLDTRAIVRVLDGHVKAVTSIDWSRNSRFVLTSSRDWTMIVWDLASPIDPPQRHQTVYFDGVVLSGEFHPHNSRIMLAIMMTGEVFLVDTRDGMSNRTEIWESVDEPTPISCARFHPSGKLIFAGTTSGHILVFNTRTKHMIARHRISGASLIRHIEFGKAGRQLLTNSSDRTIRLFNLPSYANMASEGDEYIEQELEPAFKFHDPINKISWNDITCSPDGHWVAGGAADTMGHKIYIWDPTADGRFVTALDGGRETLSCLHWHPTASAMVSTTKVGNILVWHVPRQENWGAFAGGFEEVNENVEYEEKEDEFDLEDEDQLAQRKERQEEEDVDIDDQDPSDDEKPSVYLDHEDDDLAWAKQDGEQDVAEWRLQIRIVEEY